MQLKWRLSDEPVAEDEDEELKSHAARSKVKCTIFLGYTSNMVSSGVREIIKFLVKHKMVGFSLPSFLPSSFLFDAADAERCRCTAS